MSWGLWWGQVPKRTSSAAEMGVVFTPSCTFACQSATLLMLAALPWLLMEQPAALHREP